LSDTNFDVDLYVRFIAACNTAIGLPPFGKFKASSEKGGRASCKAIDGFLLTHKAWCAKKSDCKQDSQRFF